VIWSESTFLTELRFYEMNVEQLKSLKIFLMIEGLISYCNVARDCVVLNANCHLMG
jgi:hypothetical protein